MLLHEFGDVAGDLTQPVLRTIETTIDVCTELTSTLHMLSL